MKPDVVDTAEIARRFGVEKNTVHQWRNRFVRLTKGGPLEGFPVPDFDLDVGPVWLWRTVERWGKQTGRLKP